MVADGFARGTHRRVPWPHCRQLKCCQPLPPSPLQPPHLRPPQLPPTAAATSSAATAVAKCCRTFLSGSPPAPSILACSFAARASSGAADRRSASASAPSTAMSASSCRTRAASSPLICGCRYGEDRRHWSVDA
eukprot:174047-Chlamydomonas_euryale.AAC.1